jgi:voltage-gated potassium channel
MTMTASTNASESAPAPLLSDDQALTSLTYQLFMLLVAINSVVVMVLFYLPFTPPVVRQVLYFADTIHALVFLFDFGVRLKRAPRRLAYCVRWGWLDLLTAVPLLPALRLLRVPRIVWAARMLRSQTHAALRTAARQRLAQNTLLVVVALVLLVVVYGSSAIVLVEAAAPNANIVTGGDAIWWTFVTISTVGFGDRYPVTGLGRLIGVLMLVAGVGLFSVLTSFLASAFAKPATAQDEERDRALRADVQELRAALARLEAQLAARREPTPGE